MCIQTVTKTSVRFSINNGLHFIVPTYPRYLVVYIEYPFNKGSSQVGVLGLYILDIYKIIVEFLGHISLGHINPCIVKLFWVQQG